MRLFSYLLTLLFLSSCTTIEVTKEVVNVGNVVKEKVEGKLEKKEEEDHSPTTLLLHYSRRRSMEIWPKSARQY